MTDGGIIATSKLNRRKEMTDITRTILADGEDHTVTTVAGDTGIITLEGYPTVSMKAYALTSGSETSLFLDESDALSALKLKEILGKKDWRVVELVEVKR